MPWYALATRPQREFDAVGAIEAASFEAFTPIETRVSRPRIGTKRVKTEQDRPLFVGYVFAKFEARVPWELLRAKKDLVHAILGVNGIPRVIPEAQVAAARRLSGNAQPYNWASDTRSGAVPLVGQSVEIVSGPFTGHVFVVDVADVGHIVGLLELFGTKTRIKISHEHVRAA